MAVSVDHFIFGKKFGNNSNRMLMEPHFLHRYIVGMEKCKWKNYSEYK
jgi:hypothetical protein